MSAERNGARSLYVLSNTMNVLEYLSSGLVGPLETFDKYYTDLLVRTPGLLPVLSAPPAADLTGLAVEEAGRPVLLEFTADVLPSAGETQSSVVLAAATLPLSAAKSLTFQSEADLREFSARHYENVPEPGFNLTVDPDLFNGAADLTVFETALPLATPPTRLLDYELEDRVRGGLNGIAAAAARSKDPAVIDTVLELLRRNEHGHVSALDVLATTTHLEAADVTATEHWLFETSLALLRTVQPSEEWRPRAIVQQIADALSESDLPPEDRETVERNLHRIRSIITSEVDFTPFRPGTSGLLAAKSLLMVLMRPRLTALLEWSEEETGADTAIRLAAGFLAGSLRGLKRESADSRNPAIDHHTGIVASLRLSDEALGVILPAVASTEGRNGLTVSCALTVGASTAITITTTAAPRDAWMTLTEVAFMTRASAAATSVGWKDLVTTRVVVHTPATIIGGRDRITVETIGAVDVQQRVPREEFLARVESADSDIAAALAGFLVDETPPPKPRRPRKRAT